MKLYNVVLLALAGHAIAMAKPLGKCLTKDYNLQRLTKSAEPETVDFEAVAAPLLPRQRGPVPPGGPNPYHPPK